MPTADQVHVQSLLTVADNDMGMAQVLLQNGPQYYEGIGFHCQQAAEKYLKAVLIASALPAPFIHNLVVLMGPLQQASILQFTQQDLAAAATLNEFAVELRYETDDAPDYTSAELLVMAELFSAEAPAAGASLFNLTSLRRRFSPAPPHAHRNQNSRRRRIHHRGYYCQVA